MPRHKDQNWNLHPGTKNADGSSTHCYDSIHAALLMDIRDELKELNRTLSCIRVFRMADDVHRIDQRLRKHAPLRRRTK